MKQDQTRGQPKLEVVARTDTGRVRELNEDFVAYRVPSEQDQSTAKGVLCIVADGMGGHAAGEVASKTAVEAALRAFYEHPTSDARESLQAAVDAANAAVYEQAEQQQGKPRMGTTLVAAVVNGDALHVANVGDSRAYMIRAGEIEQITEDHSWVQEQVRAGALTELQARQHPRRNVVTRALGLQPQVEVDIYDGTMEAGDVLLVCSDGLWEQVEDTELAQAVVNHSLEEATRLLIDIANSRGGPDNISLIVVKVSGPSAATVEIPAPSRATLPLPPQPAVQRRRSAPTIIGLGAAALLLVGVIGFMLTRPEEQPSSATVPPVTPAATQPPSTPAGFVPGVVESPNSSATEVAPTATLRPTFTLTPAAGSPTPTVSPTTPPPSATAPATTMAPPTPAPESTAIPTEGTPAPDQGGGTPPNETEPTLVLPTLPIGKPVPSPRPTVGPGG